MDKSTWCLCSQMYPEKALPEFQKSMSDLFNAAIPLNNRVLEIMARGLNLEVGFKAPLYYLKLLAPSL